LLKLRIAIVALLAAGVSDGFGFADQISQSATWSLADVVTATGVDTWHNQGFLGQGVRVGVIDVGFAGVDAITSDFQFPSTVDIQAALAGQFDHGARVVEVIHTLAPAATLYLYPLDLEGENLPAAVDWLLAQQVQVVNFSDVILDFPLNGQNATAQQFNRLASAGVVVAVSMGNYGQAFLTDVYHDTNDDGWHEFPDGAVAWQAYPLHSSRFSEAHLRWRDSPTNAGFDLDLYILGADGRTALAAATDLQEGEPGQQPREDVFFQTVAGQPFYIAIRGKLPERPIRTWWYLYVDDAALVAEPAAGSLAAPADSPQVIAVGGLEPNGAVYARGGRGPNWDGQIKPDLVAPVGIELLQSPGSPQVFEGTSAATPVVAGAVAVLRGAYPGMTVAQVREWLCTNARDLGSPGPDNDSGCGALWLPPPDQHP
jgi:subtilisin family serine protease